MGDFIWAMLVYFIFAVILTFNQKYIFFITIFFTYSIEISQLFNPSWLEYLRSIKLFSLVLGFTFMWSDLVAYSLGIILAFLLDYKIIQINDTKLK